MTTPSVTGLNPKVLSGIKNLMVRARTVVEGAQVGEHISPFRGGSVEFAQHRAYSPGDELRYVDWRLYARTDHYHVKQFEVTTNVRAYLLLDGSGSMGYGGEETENPGITKLDYTTTLAAALAYILIQQADTVSLTTNRQGEILFMPPRGQVGYLSQVLSVMESIKPEGEADILKLLQYAQDRIVQRSLVILFSDFLVDVDSLINKIRVLQSRGHDLLVFQVLHPDEVTFPFSRFYRFESMEDERFLTADSRNIRKHYLEALNAHQTALREAMRKGGVDFHTVQTDQPPDRVLALALNGPMRAQKLRKMY